MCDIVLEIVIVVSVDVDDLEQCLKWQDIDFEGPVDGVQGIEGGWGLLQLLIWSYMMLVVQ